MGETGQDYRPTQAPQATEPDLVLLNTKTEAKQLPHYYNLISGETSFSSMPEIIEQPSLITNQMVRMRDYSQTEDNEQASGVYQSKLTGDFELMSEPVTGDWNPIDQCYECGPLPPINNYDLVVHIHSHPAMRRWQETIQKNPDDWHLAGALPSEYDQGILLVPSKSAPQLQSMTSCIVVGRGLGIMLCKSKQTPDRTELEEEVYFPFADIVNKLFKLREDLEKNQPNLSTFKKAFNPLRNYCQEYKIGLYMIPLKGVETNNHWTRFEPSPRDLDKSIETLLL